MGGEPQGLRQRERQRALKARAIEHLFLQRTAAQRLAREADRLRCCATFEVLGVRSQRAEVDERERGLQPRGRALEASVGAVRHRSSRARRRPPGGWLRGWGERAQAPAGWNRW